RLVGLTRAELELGVCGDLDVVADRDFRAELLGQNACELEAAGPAGKVARARDRARAGGDHPGRADADAEQRARLDAGGPSGVRQRASHPGGAAGGPAPGRRLGAGGAEHAVAGVNHDRFDLRPAEIDTAPEPRSRHVAGILSDEPDSVRVSRGPLPPRFTIV